MDFHIQIHAESTLQNNSPALGAALSLREVHRDGLSAGTIIYVPTSQFELNTFGQVSVFLDICIFYKDDSDGIHGTSTVLIFADGKNGDNFPPVGQISGSFRPISGNDAAY